MLKLNRKPGEAIRVYRDGRLVCEIRNGGLKFGGIQFCIEAEQDVVIVREEIDSPEFRAEGRRHGCRRITAG